MEGGDGLKKVALLELLRGRLFGQFYPRLHFVFWKSGLKEHLKARRREDVEGLLMSQS
jgi:hypothetical protein